MTPVSMDEKKEQRLVEAGRTIWQGARSRLRASTPHTQTEILELKDRKRRGATE